MSKQYTFPVTNLRAQKAEMAHALHDNGVALGTASQDASTIFCEISTRSSLYSAQSISSRNSSSNALMLLKSTVPKSMMFWSGCASSTRT